MLCYPYKNVGLGRKMEQGARPQDAVKFFFLIKSAFGIILGHKEVPLPENA